MRKGAIKPIILGIAVLAAASWLASEVPYRVLNGPRDYYFGHVSYVEPGPEEMAPVVLREGRAKPELAVLNLPIGAGDTVRTLSGRRLELQFDTGTIVRLDVETELRVETIMAGSLSSSEGLTNLVLERGRLFVMYKEYDRTETFQVLTPKAAVKMGHKSVAIVSAAPDGSTETQVSVGKARVLFGSDEARLKDMEVRKGQRLIVQKDDQFETASAIAGTAFELWNNEINASFEELHEGLTPIPKPIQKMPAAVFRFAQLYGSRFGEWLWDDYYGYVWRPYIDNGAYPWGWQPYYYGQWVSVGSQMFWVPQEPWGWIPYHLGVWQWDKKLGWVWLPGSMFASAWATWDFYYGYACWRPWSLYDWMDAYGPYGTGLSGFLYLDGSWVYGWPYGNEILSRYVVPAKTVVRKDSLKQPTSSDLPVPAELRGVLKRVTVAVRDGDERFQESAKAVPGHLVFVARQDLGSSGVHEKVLRWDRVPKPVPAEGDRAIRAPRPVDPQREAVRAFRDAEPAMAGGRMRPDSAVPREGREVAPGPSSGLPPALHEARPGGPVARFRDWNPDLRVARELGVRIEYSSARNEIHCPDLGISSRDRERSSAFVPRLTAEGITFEFVRPGRHEAGSATDQGSSFSGSGAPSTGESAGSSRTSSGSSGASSGRGESGGGKIKN